MDWNKMRYYVIGFGTTKDSIVLILKNRPVWQAGKFNVPGGKMEPYETNYECMAREWYEETGVQTTPNSWTYVGKLYRPDDFIVSIFHQENEYFKNCHTMETEEIIICKRNDFLVGTMALPEKFMPNLLWLYWYINSFDFKKYKTVIDVFYPGKEPV